MKHCKYFGLFLLSFFYVLNVVQAQEITQSCTEIELDGAGNDSAWNNISWNPVGYASNGALQNTTGGGSVSAGQWKATFDDEFVYLLIEVYDDQQPYNSFWNDNNTGPDGTHRGWEGDGVELYLDAGGRCNGNPLQLGLTYPTSDTTTPGTYGNQACGNLTFTDFEAFISRWAPGRTSWTMEVKFPAVANGVDLTGNNIRFEVGITQSNQTSGTSSRAAIVHSFSAGDKYNNMGALQSLTVNRDNWANASVASVCAGESVNLLPDNTVFTWQQSSDNISWSDISGNVVTPAVNTYYRFVDAGNFSCPVYIEAKEIPAAPTVTTPVTYRVGDRPRPLEAVGTGTFNWFDANGSPLADAPTPATNTIGEISYFVSQTVNACESPQAEIKVEVVTNALGCAPGYEMRDVVNIDFSVLASASERRDINRDSNPNNHERFIEMSSLDYDDSGEVENGSYAIVADPGTTASWAAQGFDHTGNGDGTSTFGGMLFVNGADNPITLFRLPVSVCEQTDLTFEAWFANAHDNRDDGFPQLTFSIIDTDTGETIIEDSDIVRPVPNGTLDGRWTFVRLSFNTGTATNLRLEIRNATGSNTGNDFVIDDIKVTMCVPVIAPEWEDSRLDESIPVKAECSAADVEVPLTLNETDTANAIDDGLVWFVWQYSDDSESTWQEFGNIQNIAGNNNSFRVNIAKESPNGQRAWRLVLANSQQRITDLINGAIATGCASGIITSSILFECLPCQMPETVSLRMEGNTACIQEGDNVNVTLVAGVVNPTPPTNSVVGAGSYSLTWFENSNVMTNVAADQQRVEVSLAGKSVGTYTYVVRATKDGCSPVDSPAQNVTVNLPMIIELVAQNESGASLNDNTTAIKRGVRLEAISTQGATPQTYAWSWDDITDITDINEKWVFPLTATTYSVTAKIDETCTASASITINVLPLPTAFIPSRGDDHINSVFPVSADALDQQTVIKYKNLIVYNRYGQEVYNGDRRWDGTLKGGKIAAPGTYFYTITFFDDETLEGTIEVIK